LNLTTKKYIKNLKCAWSQTQGMMSQNVKWRHILSPKENPKQPALLESVLPPLHGKIQKIWC
jgi:hypothetical protein